MFLIGFIISLGQSAIQHRFLPPVGRRNEPSLRFGLLALPHPPPKGQSGVPPAPRRSARSPASLRGKRRAGAAVPLAAAAGPGSQAQGRQAAPLRMALEQLPGLASRGPLARW